MSAAANATHKTSFASDSLWYRTQFGCMWYSYTGGVLGASGRVFLACGRSLMKFPTGIPPVRLLNRDSSTRGTRAFCVVFANFRACFVFSSPAGVSWEEVANFFYTTTVLGMRLLVDLYSAGAGSGRNGWYRLIDAFVFLSFPLYARRQLAGVSIPRAFLVVVATHCLFLRRCHNRPQPNELLFGADLT